MVITVFDLSYQIPEAFLYSPTTNEGKNDTIKIMPCVEGDRSDCQPEASSIARI